MKKHVTARRERNRQIAEADAARRCSHCRKALTGWVEDFLEPGLFCDDECLEAHKEARQIVREARR